MPYGVRFDEISTFFNGFGYIDRSVVLGTDPSGRKNGFGAILFDTEDKAERAANDMNQEYIGDRYVDLSVITYGDYSRFNGPAGGKPGGSTVKLANFVDADNAERAVIMRGCPWKITAEEVITFFDGYGEIKNDDIFIEEFNGKRTGSVMVFFEKKETVQEAKANLNKAEIGAEKRYVELFDCEDEFFLKITKL